MATVVVKEGSIALPRDVLDAAGIREGQELAVEVAGEGSLRLLPAPSAHTAGATGDGSLSQEEYERRVAAVAASNPGLIGSPPSEDERAKYPPITDVDRESLGHRLSRGKSLVDYVLEERQEGY